ncbi:hypothetical protein AOLI_G00180480 [Acnodon oligacanthus]
MDETQTPSRSQLPATALGLATDWRSTCENGLLANDSVHVATLLANQNGKAAGLGRNMGAKRKVLIGPKSPSAMATEVLVTSRQRAAVKVLFDAFLTRDSVASRRRAEEEFVLSGCWMH